VYFGPKLVIEALEPNNPSIEQKRFFWSDKNFEPDDAFRKLELFAVQFSLDIAR
jgi:hypothetical protein